MIDIYELKTIADCTMALESIKKHKKKLMINQWESSYKFKCGENFEDLQLTLFSLNYSSKDRNITHEEELALTHQVEELFYEGNSATISRLIEIVNELGLRIDNGKIKKMICSACICENCAEIEHCNGFSCKRCKEYGYKGYDWVCEE